MDISLPWWFTVLSGFFAVFCLWRSHAANRRFRLVDALPTSRAKGVFIGLVELKGTAEGDPLISFLTETPFLKTSEAFLRLQRALTETEQRLALARDYFNGIATAYNTRLEVFPESLLGRLFGFTGQALLETADFERAAVSIHDAVPASGSGDSA